VLKLLQLIKKKFYEGKKGRHPFFGEKTIPTSSKLFKLRARSFSKGR
jgi:hypothetical protein